MNIQNVKVVIAGSFGYMDIGDEAMLSEDLWFIQSHLGIPTTRIHLLGENLKYLSSYHNHPMANCHSSIQLEANAERLRNHSDWKRAIKRRVKKIIGRNATRSSDSRLHGLIMSCNVALITGGGTINTRDPHGGSIRRMHSLVKYFRDSGLPVFMSGQTVGPLGISAEHDRLAGEIIEAVDVLTVRDSRYSGRYLDVIGTRPKELLETFDDAYTLEYKDMLLPDDCARFLADGETIAVNVTDYTADLPEQRHFIAGICERLIREDGKKVLLVSHTPKDLQSLYAILDMIPNELKEKVHLPDTRLWKDAMLKKLISCCQVAIGGRYHFIVFAGTSNTPFVGMCGNHYSYIKQDGFARALGFEDFILTERETWNEASLWSLYLRAKQLRLDLEHKFTRPSASMRRFAEWLEHLP